jgi:serine/threonine protein kinase
MLFEYVSGGELFSRLRKDGRFSKDITLFYISEILLAIQHLHRKNIIYRDLKPENLLIDKVFECDDSFRMGTSRSQISGSPRRSKITELSLSVERRST